MQSGAPHSRQTASGQNDAAQPSISKISYRTPIVVIPPPSSASWQTSYPDDQRSVGSQKSSHQYQSPIAQRSRPLPLPGTSPVIVSKPVIAPDKPVDYRILLLSLSDYYITEARSLAKLIAHNQDGADDELYYKLMATGLGCLEAVLKKLSQNTPPKQVAMLQLRYASLLYEDTDNDAEVEAMLSQGVTFCDRNRLVALKYSMQHLLARVLFKSNTKASLKYLDTVIRDVSIYHHVAWIYAFRFLRVSLLMQHATQQDIFAALHDLVAISDTARGRGDTAIMLMAAVLEALMHLRSRDFEAMRETQRAIATARAEQLNDTSQSIPQLTALMHFVDLACSLNPYDHVQAARKMSLMQTWLDGISSTSNWSRDGTFGVPVKRAADQALTADTGGIFVRNESGHDCLIFAWLSKADVYLIGFLLSGATLYYRNHQDGRSEKYLSEGLKITEGKIIPEQFQCVSALTFTDNYQLTEAPNTLSLTSACNRTGFRKILRCYMLLHQTFSRCERGSWPATQSSLQNFIAAMESPGLDPPSDLRRSATYLQAVTSHAMGDLDIALSFYTSPDLTFPDSSKAFTSPTHETLTVLAALNTLFIIRPTNHARHDQIEPILAHLSPYFSTATPTNQSPIITTNPHLRSLYHLHTALLTPTLTQKKKHLKASLDLANTVSSTSLRTLILSYLASTFFGGQTGDEARQHAVGARAAAQQSGSKLWTCVADGMLAGLVEREGRGAEAEKFWAEGEKLMGALAPGVREALGKNREAGGADAGGSAVAGGSGSR